MTLGFPDLDGTVNSLYILPRNHQIFRSSASDMQRCVRNVLLSAISGGMLTRKLAPPNTRNGCGTRSPSNHAQDRRSRWRARYCGCICSYAAVTTARMRGETSWLSSSKRCRRATDLNDGRRSISTYCCRANVIMGSDDLEPYATAQFALDIFLIWQGCADRILL